MEDIVLRTFGRKHLEATWRWVNRQDLRDLIGTVHPVPWAGHLKWAKALQADPLRRFYAIETADGLHIGNTGIKRLDPENGCAELLIYIGDKEHRGGGSGTAATRLLTEICFGGLGLRRVFVTVFSYNTAALKSYARAGFEKEAILRRHLYRGGKYHDVIVLAALSTCWTQNTTRQ